MTDPSAKVLVTGGCGYIGSHSIVDLVEAGYEVISIDDNSRSEENILKGVQKITGQPVTNYQVDLCDKAATRQVFEEHADAEAVIHFAAYKTVPESVKHPIRYYRNNLDSTLTLLELMKEFEVPYLVFSSSCSVYGNVEELPVTEDTPLGQTASPYGTTKQMCERIIDDWVKTAKSVAISLRYFNPVGAHPSAEIGEVPYGDPENLVPIINETALGQRDKLIVYGDDWDTRDGTCIRDYIHVMDVARAHTSALEYLKNQQYQEEHELYNLGTGQGVTVLEVVKAFEKATGQSLNYEIGKRRPGDVEAIYADNRKVKKRLGWKPQYDIEDMMRTAWKWDKKLAAEQASS
jgi:UDP-glucose 4-epimerase